MGGRIPRTEPGTLIGTNIKSRLLLTFISQVCSCVIDWNCTWLRWCFDVCKHYNLLPYNQANEHSHHHLRHLPLKTLMQARETAQQVQVVAMKAWQPEFSFQGSREGENWLSKSCPLISTHSSWHVHASSWHTHQDYFMYFCFRMMETGKWQLEQGWRSSGRGQEDSVSNWVDSLLHV